MQVVVLGMHRSGTSAVTRLVNMMGAYFGPDELSTGANEENPKGFWERQDVRAVCDGLLKAGGATWSSVAGFDAAAVDEKKRSKHVAKFAKTVEELDAHQPWVIKEPRLCLVLPLLRPLLSNPVAVIVHRDPIEIARSLAQRNGFSFVAGAALWEVYIRGALAASEGMPRVLVHHAQLMSNPVETAARLCEELVAHGATSLSAPPAQEISEFITADLYRQRSDLTKRNEYLNESQLELTVRLDHGDLDSIDVAEEVSAGARDILSLFEQDQQAQAELEKVRDYTDRQRSHIKRLQKRVVVLEDRIKGSPDEQRLRKELAKSEAARKKAVSRYRGLTSSRAVRAAMKLRSLRGRMKRSR